MTRSEGVNTDGGEKRLVGVKMILHILCSAERCMIRKSSSLSLSLSLFPPLSFHSLTLLVLSSADITVKAFYCYPHAFQMLVMHINSRSYLRL